MVSVKRELTANQGINGNVVISELKCTRFMQVPYIEPNKLYNQAEQCINKPVYVKHVSGLM